MNTSNSGGWRKRVRFTIARYRWCKTPTFQYPKKLGYFSTFDLPNRLPWLEAFFKGKFRNSRDSRPYLQHVPLRSTIYCEARKLSEGILPEDKTLPTSQRIRHRLGKLERAAMAANAFAMIQYYNVKISSLTCFSTLTFKTG